MLLSLCGIQKRFGGVHALSDGNLEVRAGEVHLLMGENGAGKSTLMKIVAGMYQPDAGRMMWRGKQVAHLRPADAAANGIAMVHQESLLAPHLTVAENIFLQREPLTRAGLVDRAAIVKGAEELVAANGFRISARAKVGTLTPAGKQLVEICRALAHGSSLLIFDEPTSSLSQTETTEVFRIVRDQCSRGMAVVYITHRLDELRAIGDRVTVLRDGATVHSSSLRDLSRDDLIRHMVGRTVTSVYSREHLPPGEPLLEVENLSGGVLRNISLRVRAGEIVGLAGLMGAGRTELCRALFGVDPIRAGSVTIAGTRLRGTDPRGCARAGLALIPEDRQRNGLALRLPVAHNLTMPDLGRVSRFGFLRPRAEASLVDKYATRLRIKFRSPDQLAARLSGGNQQKVVIAKWVARGARVFLFDEPTRGIDIGAKQEVFEQMHRLAQGGAAILMVSSELPELTQVCDRILVMREGSIVGELPAHSTQEEIMGLAAPTTSAVQAQGAA